MTNEDAQNPPPKKKNKQKKTKKHENMLGRKDQNKTDNTTWREIKRILVKDVQREKERESRNTVKTFSKINKILLTSGTYQQSDAKEIKQFWSKIWEQKEYIRKVEWINNMEKELQGL